MEEVIYFVSVELLHDVNAKQVGECRKDIKGTPYVIMESSSTDSDTIETPDQQMSPERARSIAGMTPRVRRIKGVDFPRSRRINFDLVEDDDDAKIEDF